MSQLVEQLKEEHLIIVDKLNQVKELGISTPEGQQELRAAKAGLLAHLQKEDQELYPQLHKAAETDGDLKNTLDLFARDMEQISQAALDFFAKYEQGGSGMDFARDFGRLYATLKKRISNEELFIYSKYDQLS